MQRTRSTASQKSAVLDAVDTKDLQEPAALGAIEAATVSPPEPVVPKLPQSAIRSSHGVAGIPPQLMLVSRLTTDSVIVTILLAAAYVVGGAEPVAVSILALSSILLSRYCLPQQRIFIRRGKMAMDAVLLLIGWFAMLGMLFTAVRLLGLMEWSALNLFATWGAVTPVALLAAHACISPVANRLSRPEHPVPVVVAGINPVARSLAETIDQEPILGRKLVGYFDDRPAERVSVNEKLLLGTLGDLPDYVKKNKIQCVYLTLPWNAQPRVHKLIDELKDSTASICFVTDFESYGLFEPRFFRIGDIRGVSICHSPIEGTAALGKRIFDIIFSLAGIILLAPVMLMIAVLVKMSSPGPVIFKQSRYGLDGREIKVLKFRTLRVVENDAMLRQVTKDDPRATPIGSVLRRTSLDELPQLFNVLQGSMSLVGPRPHANAHNEIYRRLVKGYMLRHKVTPGITGLAQVSGCRGETETVEKMATRVAYDLNYIQNWSFWLDIEIIIRTFTTVWRRTNAY